ncbi:MAG: metallophosphoesterase [Nanoarchaeota archaeon]|nr:metallophosphoesterase [Nanoarchaeota archaeon]
MKIEFIGKSLLIEMGNEKVLVVGDLHLGYEGSLHESGYNVPINLYKETIKDFDKIFDYIRNNKKVKLSKQTVGEVGLDDNNLRSGGVVDKVVILGDLKHEFGKILKDEWKEISDLLDYLKEKCKKIIIVKGNHDVIIEPITKKKKVGVLDYWIYHNYCFLHGDRDFSDIYDREIKYWIIGHGHPAISLRDKVKTEKYKCFLVGKYKGKKVIIVPSFFHVTEGSDVRDYDLGLAWNFELKKFGVKIVGENLEVLDFGELRKLR